MLFKLLLKHTVMVFGIFLILLFPQKSWIWPCNGHYCQATLQCSSYIL